MVIYVSLKIFFVNKLSSHPGKYIMVVYHLQKDSGKFSWKFKKVNGTRLFGSFQRKISGNNGTSEKVVLFFPTEYSKQKFVFHSSKPSLIPVSGLRGRFPINGTDSHNVVNANPGRNLPVLNFAYHLPKPWTDRFAHVDGKQPITQQFIRLLFPEWLLCTELEQNFLFIPLWSLSTLKEFVLFRVKLEIRLSQHLAERATSMHE